jgi:glycosyltransferase involved in cell wall biosynthesis
MPKPSISVIIPVFNTEKYLAQAIKSVLEQTVQPDEIIVVDDGSTDKSVEVARHFEPRIKIITQQNKGAGAARNAGIKQASGEYLAFLDADDLWVENKLKQQLSYLENHPETDMIFGIVAQFVSPELSAEHQSKLKTELEKMPGYVTGAMLIKHETFMKVGLLNEKLELGEFIDWFSRAKDMGLNYNLLDEIVLKRRIHTTNLGIYKKQNLKDYTSILREALARKRKMMNSNEE